MKKKLLFTLFMLTFSIFVLTISVSALTLQEAIDTYEGYFDNKTTENIDGYIGKSAHQPTNLCRICRNCG